MKFSKEHLMSQWAMLKKDKDNVDIRDTTVNKYVTDVNTIFRLIKAYKMKYEDLTLDWLVKTLKENYPNKKSFYQKIKTFYQYLHLFDEDNEMKEDLHKLVIKTNESIKEEYEKNKVTKRCVGVTVWQTA